MSWKFIASRGTALVSMAVFCLALMQLSVAQEIEETGAQLNPDHSIRIEYCVNWGSAQAFRQTKAWLEYNFPELRGKVTGADYPIPPTIELLQKILSTFQMMGMAVAMLGDNAFRLIGMQQTPSWYHDVLLKNSVPIMIGLYLLLPTILNGFTVSGAFEIYLDGSLLVFSKLEAERLPTSEDLIVPLRKAGLMIMASALES